MESPTLKLQQTCLPPSEGNIVIDNMVYNASFGAFSYTEVPNTGLKNVLIANNTVIGGNFSTGDYSNYSVVNSNSQVINNIFSGTANKVPSNSGITFSNNIWGNATTAGQSSTDIAGDPLLAKTGSVSPGELTADYFRLLAGSPVIDKGMILADVSDDYLGTQRDNAPDLGA